MEEDIYYAAEIMTWLLFYVNPNISKEHTFELVLDLLNQGMDKRSVKKYGALIVKTSSIQADKNGKKIH